MKISCLRSDLQTAISNVSRAVSSKSTIPALEGVLVKAYGDKLNISGYNLEIGITTDIEATIKEEGEIVISARLFFDIVRNLPEEILTIETDDRLVIYIQCGAADYKITGMSSVEYPDLPAFEQTDGITLSSKTLREMIRQTVYAVSENTAKPIYTGSLYEIENSVLTIVAIDGYRMAVRRENVTSDSETSFIVPGKTQLEILKLLSDDEEPVDIIIGQRHITFKVKNYRVISRLIEGIFIDYKTTIPSVAKTEVVIKENAEPRALQVPRRRDKVLMRLSCRLRKRYYRRYSCRRQCGDRLQQQIHARRAQERGHRRGEARAQRPDFAYRYQARSGR